MVFKNDEQRNKCKNLLKYENIICKHIWIMRNLDIFRTVIYLAIPYLGVSSTITLNF